MKNMKQLIGALLMILIFAPTMAMARPDVRFAMTAHTEVVVEENGKQVRKLVQTDFITPNATLVYQIEYINAGDEPATGVVIDNPVPNTTTYIGDTAWGEGAEIVFSVDGGKTYAKPTLLTVEITLADGSKQKRTATPDQYTHIRWTINKIAAGARGDVGYRVSVEGRR